MNSPRTLLPLLLAVAACGAEPTERALDGRLSVREPDVDSGAPQALQLVDRATGLTCTPMATSAGLRCRPDVPVVAFGGMYDWGCEDLAVVVPAELELVEITGTPRAGIYRLLDGRSGCTPVSYLGEDGTCTAQRTVIQPDTEVKHARPYPPEEWPTLEVAARAEPRLAAELAAVCGDLSRCE